ncbi:MAG: FkbM family methyltransferase [Acidobacteriota bacterium]
MTDAAQSLPLAERERALLFSRWRYYLASIPTLLLRIRSWPAVLAIFAGLPVKRPVTIVLQDGSRFRVRGRMDVWIIKETCLDRDYERGAVSVEDGWTVVDIGAGSGDFAISVARRSARSRVFAFEPLPESFGLLLENLRLNGLSNVTPFPEAIAGRQGELLLYTKTGLEGQHRTAQTATPETGGALRVPSISLEAAFDRSDITVCDLLKIDCEGGEYDILFGASAEALSRVRHIAMEFHDGITAHSHEDLVPYLESHGFRVRTRPNPAHANLGFLFAANRRLEA